MKKTLLFAVDANKEETIVSESAKGSYQIQPVERITRLAAPLLYQAVALLGQMAKDANLDAKVFSSMDKVCQMLYAQYKESP